MEQALNVLLSRLAADIERRDGDAAVNTLEKIHAVNPAFAELLIFHLAEAGVRRILARHGQSVN
ncbi:hypothetical protein [Actinoplanes sp. NPDC023714]|uniref:hypothetical protein n=1 Tax=Actinoplanes sp. NPDC023714 TaxID=3154322 RepID=UPI0033D8338F